LLSFMSPPSFFFLFVHSPCQDHTVVPV
jgi:hypothetical protein